MSLKTTHPAEGTRGNLDGRMRTALLWVAISGAGRAGGGAALSGARDGLSVAVGASLATANLWALARVVGALLPDDDRAAARQGRGAWSLLALSKTAGLLVVAWLLLRYRVTSPLPMLVGFASLPIGIAIGSLVSDRSSARS
jgi:hypothetical protein